MKFIESIISFSVNNKFIIGLFMLVLIGAGLYSAQHIPIDAVPDITNNQVQVVTVSPSLSPQEVEQFITYPVEVSVANIPNVTEIRSVSRFGLSVVTIVFEDWVEILDARQFVKEQISIAEGEIPPGLGTPELMPITTGLGEIYQYVIQAKPGYEDQYDAMELRTIQDWIVKRQLAGITGIVEVSSFGGYLKQYEVAIDPVKLNSLDLSITDVYAALERNNQNSGGSYIEKGPNASYIRTEGLVSSLDDVAKIVIDTRQGVPIMIKDIGTVRFGAPPRFGAMTMNGQGEAVGGITLMLKGANSSEAIDAVHDRVAQVQLSLPEGLVIEPYLDRSVLVGKTIKTVAKNLIEGGLIVVFVLVLMLGNFRAGFIVASVIPLAMMFALTMMYLFGVSANLMSLGAIDFGIVVDGAVIIVEGVLHILYTDHIGKKLKGREMNEIIIEASGKIYKSAAFGVLIILMVFIPIMSLTGVEGKMFRPMAQTVSFALLGALILSLTYVPMMSALILKKDIKEHNSFADRLVGWLRNRYKPTIEWALKRPAMTLGVAVVALALTGVVFSGMGSEFIPDLEEGDLAMQMTIQPGSSLSESVATTTQAEKILLENFPEVDKVVSKIGTAEVPTDPMAVEDADIMIILKEKDEWTSADNREELVELMKEKLAVIPGASFDFTQPIKLRFNELMTGAKTDIAIKIFGEDLDELADLGNKAAGIIAGIDGAGDVKVEQTEGLPQAIIKYDRDKIARYGLNIEELNQIVNAAYAGGIAGVVFEGEKKFDLVVRLNDNSRKQLDLNKLFIQSPAGGRVPLSEVATLQMKEGPMQVSRENTHRRIIVGVNVRNRDIASLVAEIEQKLGDELRLPPGYYITYGGQFENLESARKRLMVAVPIALLLIVILLYFAFGSFKYALLIFSAVPLSAIGGVMALFVRGMPFSISAGVGFIALFGVAVLNGIVLISYYNQLKEEGKMSLKELIVEGGMVRMRPVLMTALVASFGFLPMALSTTAGAEVQKPLATVVIGGLISATLLTLIVLPVLYYLFEKRSYKMSGGVAGILLVAGLLGTTDVQAQTPLSLEAALSMADSTNVELLNAQYELDIATKQRKAWFQLDGPSAGVQYGQMNNTPWDWYFEVDQNLGSVVTHIQNNKYTRQAVELAESQLQLSQLQISYRVKAAWYQWAYAFDKWQLLTEQYNMVQELADKADLQYQVGEIAQVERSLILTQLAGLAQDMVFAEQEMNQAENVLKNLLMLNEDLVPEMDTLTPLPYDLLGGGEASEILTMPWQKQQQLLQAESKLIRSSFFPDLSVGYFNQEIEDVKGFQGVKLGVSIPIWFWGTRSKVQQQKLQVNIAQNNWQQQKLENNNQLQQLHDQAVGLNQQLELYTSTALENARLLQQTATTEFDAGEIDHFKMLQSQQLANSLQLKYLNLLNQYNQTIIKLEYLQQ